MSTGEPTQVVTVVSDDKEKPQTDNRNNGTLIGFDEVEERKSLALLRGLTKWLKQSLLVRILRNVWHMLHGKLNAENLVLLLHRVHGTPPARVLQNRPPWYSFHRLSYYWWYVLLRVYKVSWLKWLPSPRAAPRYRLKRSARVISALHLFARKVLSVFSRKGGVGKTSLVKAMTGRIKYARNEWTVVVQDNNPDSGTLADRCERTTPLALPDLVHASRLGAIGKVQDYLHYCNVMKEGSWLLASNRPEDYEGEFNISPIDFMSLDELSTSYVDCHLYDCGTDSGRATTVAALRVGNVIYLVTTPASDSLKQTKQAYVWMCKYADITRKHVVLVVNRRHWWNNLDAIEADFIRTADDEQSNETTQTWRPRSFRALGVGWDIRLALGRNFTSDQLRAGVRADIDELIATGLLLVADAYGEDPLALMTHIQRIQWMRNHPETDPCKGDSLDHERVTLVGSSANQFGTRHSEGGASC